MKAEIKFYVMAPSVTSINKNYDVICISDENHERLFRQYISNTPWVSAAGIPPQIAERLLEGVEGWSVGCYTPKDHPVDETILVQDKLEQAARSWAVLAKQIGGTMVEPLALVMEEIEFGNC